MANIFDIFKRKNRQKTQEVQEVEQGLSYEDKVKCIKNKEIYEGFEQDFEFQDTIILSDELVNDFISLLSKSANANLLERLNPDFTWEILTNILLEHYQEDVAMQVFLQNYKLVPEIIESPQFTSLVNADNFKYVKGAIMDYCMWIDECNKLEDGNIYAMSKGLKKEIAKLEKNVEFFYSEKDFSYIYGQAIGLNVSLMTAEHAIETVKNATEFAEPTIDNLMLVRATDIFPTNNTIESPYNSSGCGQYLKITNDEINYKCLYQAVHDILGAEVADGKSYQQLVDVQQQVIADGRGEEILNLYDRYQGEYKINYKLSRADIHFAINTRVAEVGGGNAWDSMALTIIEPYKHHHGEFENLYAVDSFKNGNLELKQPTLMIDEVALKKLLEQSKTNEGIKATLKNSEIVIINPNTEVGREIYVQAYLLERGLPAYRCSNFFVMGVNNNAPEPTVAKFLQDVVAELNDKGYNTTSMPHMSTKSNLKQDEEEHKSLAESTLNFTKQFIKEKFPNEFKEEYMHHIESNIEPLKKALDEILQKVDTTTKTQEEFERKTEELLMDRFGKKVGYYSDITNRLRIMLEPELEKYSDDEIKKFIEKYNKEFQASVIKQIGHKSVIISNDIDIEKVKQYRERLECAQVTDLTISESVSN